MKKEIQEIVDNLYQGIVSGKKLWRPPFGQACLGRAQNFMTQTKYKGVNSVLLNIESYSNGYSTNNWLTFKQLAAMNAKVRKGERSTRIVFFTFFEKATEDSADVQIIPTWKYYNVFNVDQTDGLIAQDKAGGVSSEELLDNPSVNDFTTATGAVIQHSDKRAAFYSPGKDLIHLPYQKHFQSTDSYYATLLHELVHWTGHTSRLDRLKVSNTFGSHGYGFEELVAELGATFLSADLNVNSDIENHVSYLQSWAELMKDKKMSFFKAATLAERATEFLYDLVNQKSDVAVNLAEKAA